MNNHNRGSEQNNIYEESEHFGLVGRNAEELSDCNAWYNRFLREVTKRVNAEIFKPIICDSENLLPDPHFVIGFMVLKESWNQSFDFIRGLALLDPGVRLALGIREISRVPSGSSVFGFLKKCRDYCKATGQDLLNRAFLQTVQGRVQSYETDGALIRVDKTLLENYVPDMISLEKAQHALETGINSFSGSEIPVPPELRKAILEILETDVDEFVYRHSSSDVNGRKWLLGKLLFLLIKHCRLYKDKESLQVKVFNEQFRCSLENTGDGSADDSEDRKHDADDSKKSFSKTQGSENRNQETDNREQRSVTTDKSENINHEMEETEERSVSSELSGKSSCYSEETDEDSSESLHEKSLSDSADNGGLSLWDLMNADENQVKVEPRRQTGTFPGEEHNLADENASPYSDIDWYSRKSADMQTEYFSSADNRRFNRDDKTSGSVSDEIIRTDDHSVQIHGSEDSEKTDWLNFLKEQTEEFSKNSEVGEESGRKGHDPVFAKSAGSQNFSRGNNAENTENHGIYDSDEKSFFIRKNFHDDKKSHAGRQNEGDFRKNNKSVPASEEGYHDCGSMKSNFTAGTGEHKRTFIGRINKYRKDCDKTPDRETMNSNERTSMEGSMYLQSENFSDLKSRWQKFESLVKNSISWIDDAAENSAKVRNEQSESKNMLRDCLFESEVMLRACDSNPGLGIFGSSQVGKSYLVSAFASSSGESNSLFTRLGNEQYDFIKSINPQGSGKESTGLVTRFTTRTFNGIENSDYPVRLELLSEGDLVKVFINSYFNDFKDILADFENIKSSMRDHYASFRREHSGISGGISAMEKIVNEIIAVSRYVKSRHDYLYNALGDEFWDYGQSVVSQMDLESRVKFYSILWNDLPQFTEMLRKLLEQRSKLGFDCSTVHAAINSIIKNGTDSNRSIINVDALNFFSNNSPENSIAVKNYAGSTFDVNCGVLAALTSEIVIPVENPRIQLISKVDLLDFPGYRSRLSENPKSSSGQSTVSFFLRGKVSYLFEKYTENHLMNALLVCTNADGQVENTDMQKVITSWINKTQGASPKDRGSHNSGFFWALTKFDRRISSDLDKGDSLEYGRSGLLQQTVLERFEFEEWFKDWSGRPFNNIVLVRKPGTLDCSFVDKNPDTGFELQIPDSYKQKINYMRERFIADPDVRKYINDPETAWDSMLELNDGGLTRTAALIATADMDEIKLSAVRRGLHQRITAVLRKLTSWVESDDYDLVKKQQHRKARTLYEYFKKNLLFTEEFGDVLSLFTPTQEFIGNAYDSAVNADHINLLHEQNSKNAGISKEQSPLQESVPEGDVSWAFAESKSNKDTDSETDNDDDFDFDMDVFDEDSSSSEEGDSVNENSEESVQPRTIRISIGERIYEKWCRWLRSLSEDNLDDRKLLNLDPSIVDIMANEIIALSESCDLKKEICDQVELIESLINTKSKAGPIIRMSIATIISDFVFSCGNQLKISAEVNFDKFGNPELDQKPSDKKNEMFLKWFPQFKDVMLDKNITAKRDNELTVEQNSKLKNYVSEFQKLDS